MPSVGKNGRKLKPCKSHQYRDPITNRCRNRRKKSNKKRRKPYKPCKSHQYRDPVSHRCRNRYKPRKSRKSRKPRRSPPRKSRSSSRRSPPRLAGFSKCKKAYEFLKKLGVDCGPRCKITEARKKVRKLALQYHPDKGGRKSMMQAINDAADQVINDHCTKYYRF